MLFRSRYRAFFNKVPGLEPDRVRALNKREAFIASRQMCIRDRSLPTPRTSSVSRLLPTLKPSPNRARLLTSRDVYKRQLVHIALRGNDAVDTHSEGSDPDRHVVIALFLPPLCPKNSFAPASLHAAPGPPETLAPPGVGSGLSLCPFPLHRSFRGSAPDFFRPVPSPHL